MYTAIVAGILIFPWTLVGVSIVGWLAHRKVPYKAPSARRNSGNRLKESAFRL